MKDLLSSNGLKVTKNRLSILEVLQNTNIPINAYEVQKKLNEKSLINISTVYRVLQKLTKANLVHKIEKLNAYIICIKTKQSCECHHLFICSICNKIVEFIDHSICKIQNKLAIKNKFKTKSHSLEIIGICNNCN